MYVSTYVCTYVCALHFVRDFPFSYIFILIDNQITPTRILIVPPKTEIQAGSSIILMCTATGWPIPFMTYSKDGEMINSSRFSYIIRPEDSFTVSLLMNVTNAEINDTGNYTCSAVSHETGDIGEDHEWFIFGVKGTYICTCHATVDVRIYLHKNAFLIASLLTLWSLNYTFLLLSLDAPSITRISSDVVSSIQQSVVLECVAVGYPLPDIHWISTSLSSNSGYGGSSYYLSYYTTTTANGFITTHSLLTLSPIVLDDDGIYTCIANNTEGTTNASVEINVLGEIQAFLYMFRV